MYYLQNMLFENFKNLSSFKILEKDNFNYKLNNYF